MPAFNTNSPLYLPTSTVALAASLAALSACTEPADAEDTSGAGETSGFLDGSTTDTASSSESSDAGESTGDESTATSEGGGTDSGTDASTGSESGDDTDTGGGDSGCDTPDPGWGAPTVGAEPKHFGGINHDGTPINICDFKGERIVVDISAEWCGPCIMWAEVTSGAVDVTDPALGVDEESKAFFLALKAAIDDGSIRWVTYLADPGTVDAAAAWASAYEHEKIPVFVPNPGEESQLQSMFVTGAWPNFMLINEDFVWESTSAWPTDLEELGWM